MGFFKMIGKTISKYEILARLGAGGMGEVYLAEDLELNRKVALKFFVSHLINDPEKKARFKQEAQVVAALNHPNIVTVYEIAEFENTSYIAMEYVDGRTLKALTAGKPMEIAQALELAIQICDGLREAHRAGIVHRDLKSENILVNKRGQAKILDFGLAKIKSGLKLSRDVRALGTVDYMSPEQAMGKEVDHRSDIFSFGVVLSLIHI